MSLIDSCKAAVDVARRPSEVERHRYRGSRSNSRIKEIPLFAEVLEQHITAERDPNEKQSLVRMLQQPVDNKSQIGSFPRMVESPGVIHLTSAGPEYQHVGGPSPSSRLSQKSLSVLGSNSSLEPVQQ